MYRNSIKEPTHDDDDCSSSGSSLPRRDSLSLLNYAIVSAASQEGRVSLNIRLDCFIFDIAPVC